jgi:hypothetical protein
VKGDLPQVGQSSVLRAVVDDGEPWEDPSEDLLFMLLSDLEMGRAGRLRVERLDEPGQALEVSADDGSFRVHRYQGDRVIVADSNRLKEVHAACVRWAFRMNAEAVRRAQAGWAGFDGTLAWRIGGSERH